MAEGRAPRGLDRDFRALLALANPWSDGQAILRELEQIGPLDWDVVSALALRHRIMPLIARRIALVRAELNLPATVAAHFSQQGQIALFHEMALLAELKRIKQALDDAGLRFLVIKGLVLSSDNHGAMGWRTNHDIDLVVAPQDMARAHVCLSALGIRRIEPEPDMDATALESGMERSKDWVYLGGTGDLVIELHHRLFDNHHLCAQGLFERSRRVTLFGQTKVETLGDEDGPAYLALHGALHAWSRLKWLIDMAFVLRKLDGAALGTLLNTHQGKAGDRALGQALILCRDLFGVRWPATTAKPRASRILTASARHALTSGGAVELEDSRFGTTLKNISHYALWFNPAYLWAELRFDLTDTSRDKVDGRSRVPIWMQRLMRWFERHGGKASLR